MIPDPSLHSLGLCYFRNLVARCYREIRYFGQTGHYEPLRKYYPPCQSIREDHPEDGRVWVDPLYWSVENETDVNTIESVFAHKVGGMTLEEMRLAFLKGSWSSSTGGTKWADIVQATITLREAIRQQNAQDLSSTIDKIKHLRHNTRQVVADFIAPCT